MFRADSGKQSAFRSIPTRDTEPEDRDPADVFYVGLGDRFDGDRRLVREATLGLTGGPASPSTVAAMEMTARKLRAIFS